MPLWSTAISHYKSLFKLIGADDVCHFLSSCLDQNEIARPPTFGFRQFRVGSREFVTRDDPDAVGLFGIGPLPRQLMAIDKEVASSFFDGMRRQPVMGSRAEFQIIREADLNKVTLVGRSYVANDGLATLDNSDPTLEPRPLWDIEI